MFVLGFHAWIQIETQSIDSLKGEYLLVGACGLPSSYLRPVTFAPKFALHAIGVFVGFAGVLQNELVLGTVLEWSDAHAFHAQQVESFVLADVLVATATMARSLAEGTDQWTRWHASERDHNRHARVPVLAIWQTPSSISA